MGAAIAGVGVLPLFFYPQGGLQQGGEAVEGCVYGGFAQSVEMVLAEAEQQAAVAAAVDAGQLQGQGGGGFLFGAGGGGGEFGGEEVEMEGVRPGAAVVVVGEFLQGFVAPRQAAVFDWLAAVKLAGVDAGRAFDVAGEGGGFGDECGPEAVVVEVLVEGERGEEDEVLVEVGEVHGRLLGAVCKRRAVCLSGGLFGVGAAVEGKPLQPRGRVCEVCGCL